MCPLPTETTAQRMKPTDRQADRGQCTVADWEKRRDAGGGGAGFGLSIKVDITAPMCAYIHLCPFSNDRARYVACGLAHAHAHAWHAWHAPADTN